MTTDERVVTKQEIQEVESAKQAGVPYAHHRYQARDTNTKLLSAAAETFEFASSERQEAFEDWGRMTCVVLLK